MNAETTETKRQPFYAEKDSNFRAWNVMGPKGYIASCPGGTGEREAKEWAEELNRAYELGRLKVRS